MGRMQQTCGRNDDLLYGSGRDRRLKGDEGAWHAAMTKAGVEQSRAAMIGLLVGVAGVVGGVAVAEKVSDVFNDLLGTGDGGDQENDGQAMEQCSAKPSGERTMSRANHGHCS